MSGVAFSFSCARPVPPVRARTIQRHTHAHCRQASSAHAFRRSPLRLGFAVSRGCRPDGDGGGGSGSGSGGGGGSSGGSGGSGGRDDNGDRGPRWHRAAGPIVIGSGALRRRVPRTRTTGGGGGGQGGTVRQFLMALRMSHVLLAVNVAVFVLQGTMGSQLLLAGAKVNAAIAAGQLHRLFTPMFLHASFTHLMVNAFSLYSTGPSVESWFGRARFVSLYLMSGICGNVLSFFCTPTPSVGASGAIFGLVGATAVLLGRHRKILGPRSRKGLNSLAYIVLVNFGMGMSPNSRIDNFGHLGGLLGGVVFAYFAGPRLVPARAPDGKNVLVDVPLTSLALAEARRSVGKLIGRGRGRGFRRDTQRRR
jgi:membrane associated rhomboid family serine protease